MDLIGCVALLASLLALLTFDQLIEREYAFHPEAWDEDHRPVGFCFWPRESRVMADLLPRPASGLALLTAVLFWLFATPGWIRHDPPAWRLVWRYRLAVTVAIVGFAIVAGYLAAC